MPDYARAAHGRGIFATAFCLPLFPLAEPTSLFIVRIQLGYGIVWVTVPSAVKVYIHPVLTEVPSRPVR